MNLPGLDTTERETEAQARYGMHLGITQSVLELALESRALLPALGPQDTVNPAGVGLNLATCRTSRFVSFSSMGHL